MIQIFQTLNAKKRILTKQMHSAIKLTLWRYYLWNHKFARALNQWHFRWEFNASQFHFVLMMDWLCAWKAIQCEKSENEIETELNPYKLPSSSLCSRRSAAACPFGGIHAERKQQKCCIFIYTTEKLNVELLSLWVCVRCAHGFFSALAFVSLFFLWSVCMLLLLRCKVLKHTLRLLLICGICVGRLRTSITSTYALIIFHFHFKVFDLFKTND